MEQLQKYSRCSVNFDQFCCLLSHPRVSPSRAPVLPFAHPFQAPATQANFLNANCSLSSVRYSPRLLHLLKPDYLNKIDLLLLSYALCKCFVYLSLGKKKEFKLHVTLLLDVE